MLKCIFILLFVDFALTVPSELESVLRLKTVNYFVTRRPWLGMYNAATMVIYYWSTIEFFAESKFFVWSYSFIVFLVLVKDLYGVNVRPVAPFGSASRKPHVDSSLLHRCLPDELLFEVLYFTWCIWLHYLVMTFWYGVRLVTMCGSS